MKQDYANKLAFVLGASEGIGKSIAEKLALLGSDVIITSRNNAKLEKAKKEIEANGGSIKAVSSFDLTNNTQTQFSIDNLVNKFGVPDYFFNCAGFAHPGYIENQEIDIYRSMMELNYFGTVHACKAILPHLIKNRKGHIINVSSLAGFLGLFGYSGYCASKFAVIGFSEALRRELKPLEIKVSVLCPPNTRTPGLDRENKVKPKEVLATEEKVKVIDPQYVAEKLLQALPKNKFMIIPTFDGRLTYYLNRYFPFIIEQFTKRPKH